MGSNMVCQAAKHLQIEIALHTIIKKKKMKEEEVMQFETLKNNNS